MKQTTYIKAKCGACGVEDTVCLESGLCQSCADNFGKKGVPFENEEKKLRIGLISDLHLEFYQDPWRVLDKVVDSADFLEVDWICIAGDLGYSPVVPKFLAYLSGKTDCEIFYVPGNHEFYHGHISDIDNLMKQDLPGTVHLLQRDFHYDLKHDVLIAGSCGWIDGSFKEIYNHPVDKFFRSRYNDFTQIKGFKKLARTYGKADYRSIARHLSNPARVKIAMTHFLPHPECINLEYTGNALNACYCNDWYDILADKKPDYWFHGHSHCHQKVKIHETECIINAAGYPDRSWNSNTNLYVIEV